MKIMDDKKTIKESVATYTTIPSTSTIIEPFVQRGLFESEEKAVAELARTYVVAQIQQYQKKIEALQAQYGMSYEQFEAYLQIRANELLNSPNPTLNQALMREEDDAFDWKTALEMQSSWLGLQVEAGL